MKKIVVMLAALLIVAMVAGCLEGSTPDATPTPTPTPVPTATPTPTPTPTPTVAPELEYLDKVMELNERTSNILARFGGASADFSEGKIGLATLEYIHIDCSDDMMVVAIEATFLDPPHDFEEFHGHWIKSINLCDSAMFEATLYFVDEDINHIYLATDMLEESTRETDLATAALP